MKSPMQTLIENSIMNNVQIINEARKILTKPLSATLRDNYLDTIKNCNSEITLMQSIRKKFNQ